MKHGSSGAAGVAYQIVVRCNSSDAFAAVKCRKSLDSEYYSLS